MAIEELENALEITTSLLEKEKCAETRRDLSTLTNLLYVVRERVCQSITFDSFTGAIETDDCSGYLQELEDCLNEVHLQISEELDKSYNPPSSQQSDSTEEKFPHNAAQNYSEEEEDELLNSKKKNNLSKLSDDEGIGLPDIQVNLSDEILSAALRQGEDLLSEVDEGHQLISMTMYEPSREEQGLIADTRSKFNVRTDERTELYIHSLERELLSCKTQYRTLVVDRAELLEKLRLIHGVLEDKQRQLNTYISECEERLLTSQRERDSAVMERDSAVMERDSAVIERDNIAADRDNMESDKWDIMKQLRETEDRCEGLQQEIKYRDGAIKSLQEEVDKMSQECMCNSLDSLQSRTMSRSSSLRSKSSMSSKGSGLSRILTLRRHHESDTDSFGDEEAAATNPKKKSRPRLHLPLFSEDGEREKRKLLESLAEVPMNRWKSDAVVAWLELVVKMPMYAKACSDNVKSGKVLLSLSDADIGTGFGMTNVLHKRKLRLAVEEARCPDSATYPAAGRLDSEWVVDEWLPSVGLNQYKGVFRENLVDGRLLNSLTKKDIEKNLCVLEKWHQSSLMLAIELLARHDFDIVKLSERRNACQHCDRDVEVWTTARCAEWLISIDLKEYANKLTYSGIHGAVIVHDSSFNVDTLATALGIPIQRKVLRRHMEQELTVLKSGGSRRTTSAPKHKSGRFKGSLTRAFKNNDNDQIQRAFKPQPEGQFLLHSMKSEQDTLTNMTFAPDSEIYA